jgi:hypothetical protein
MIKNAGILRYMIDRRRFGLPSLRSSHHPPPPHPQSIPFRRRTERPVGLEKPPGKVVSVPAYVTLHNIAKLTLNVKIEN